MSIWQDRHHMPCTLRRPDAPDDPCMLEYLYAAGPIAAIRVLRAPQGTVCIAWRDGRTAQWRHPKLDVGGTYQAQFGVSVRQDGSALFVQTFDQGLHCLDAATGRTLWRSKSRRGVTSVLVGPETLVAHQHEQALLLMDVHTGEVLREKRPARAWEFYALTPEQLICQTTARQWEIIRAGDLETLQVIPHRLFPNTSGELPWCIRDVWLEDGGLWCSAFRPAAPDSTETIDAVFPIPVPLTFPR